MLSSLTNKCTFINLKNTLKFTLNTHKYGSYMFRPLTIIRELALNLAKVIFMLKHSMKVRRYLLCGCVWQHAAAFGEITSLFIMRLCGSMLQHSVKLRRYLLCGCVAACCSILKTCFYLAHNPLPSSDLILFY